MYKKDSKGLIFNIQRFSLHDGPGIRTIVFLKGCAMSCLWCSNTESQSARPQVMFNEKLCVECGKCKLVCGVEAIDLASPYRVIQDKCTVCGSCVEVCPTGALVVSGEVLRVEEVVDELKKDSVHYRRSDGGITLSGGEPLLQSEFCEELLKGCKTIGWHTAIETAMYVSEKAVRRVAPYVDLFLLDIKSMDSLTHREFTGVDNEIILKNAKLVDDLSKEIVIRVPVIQGFNSDEKSIREIAEFSKTLKKVKEVHLLPYHNYGENKYRAVGKEYRLKDAKTPDKEKMGHLKLVVEKTGLKCSIGS